MLGKPNERSRPFSMREPAQVKSLPPYNLFARKDATELFCAIPEDRPVPDFIDRDWQFKGSVDRSQNAPGGFIPPVAAASVRLNGYYVFMRYDALASPEDDREVRSIFQNLAKQKREIEHEHRHK